MQRKILAYQSAHILTAKPGDVILSLYDGVTRFCYEAKEAIGANDPARKGVAIGRAYDIIWELTACLDEKHDPQLCESLRQQYGHWMARLQAASIEMAAEPVDEVLGLVLTMRRTWEEAIGQARREGARA